MGTTINAAACAMPYINGVRHNAYINGRPVWSAYPPGAVVANSEGNIFQYSCESSDDYCNILDVSCTIYTSKQAYVGKKDFYGFSPGTPLSIGVGNYAIITYCFCGQE